MFTIQGGLVSKTMKRSRESRYLVLCKNRKKVVVHRGGTIKKGRLINVAQCHVAGKNVSVAGAANRM